MLAYVIPTMSDKTLRMKTGFFRSSDVEKKNRAASITTSAEPMVAEIIKNPREGPTAATHMVPGGARGMRGAEGLENIVQMPLKSMPQQISDLYIRVGGHALEEYDEEQCGTC